MEEQVWTKKKKILIACLGILAVGLLIYNIFFSSNGKNDFEIVKSSSKFYTVSNCVYRYITYVQSKSSDNVLLTLDSKYKKDNNINKDNIFEKISVLDGNYNFEGRKMYQQKLNDDTTKYYGSTGTISISITPSTSSSYSYRYDFYLKVYDSDNKEKIR